MFCMFVNVVLWYFVEFGVVFYDYNCGFFMVKVVCELNEFVL